ncbi:elongation factor G [soil metagenome]
MAADKVYDLAKFRNIGVIAHIDAGKTTTTDHILYYAGAKHKLGSVDAGTTETDYDPEEQERGITIYSACIPFQWRDCTVNLIDTPGHVDFTAEVERSLRVLDGAVVVFDAQKGVEAQSETVWRQAEKYGVPRLVFVNKMDVVGANFANAVEEVRERLEGRPLALTLPIGSGSVKDSQTPFEGVIDLITMKAYYYNAADQGKTFTIKEIPESLAEDAKTARDQLFDKLTEHDEHDLITSSILEGKVIPEEQVYQLLREQTIKGLIQPVLCGSGREHMGVQLLMDAITRYLPSPLDRPPVEGSHPKKPDKKEKRKPDPTEPFCGLVFKVVSDKHGDRFFVRIYSGKLKSQSRVYNSGKDAKELISKIYHIHADPKRNLEEVDEAVAGDIVALVSLRESITGDTLCDSQQPILLEAIHFAESVVSQSVEPQSSADKDRLVATLDALRREDPTFVWKIDKDTGQTLISGMGMLHLEIKRHRMERDFNLKVRVGKPYVSYRETIREKRSAHGGIARFETYLDVQLVPVPSDTPLLPTVQESGDFPDVPGVLREAARQGVAAALQSGELGFPVINVQAFITGYTIDPQLTTDVAVQAAASDAVNKALTDNIVLLEPVMHLEVTLPEEYLGPVTADLNVRRAEISQLLTRGKLRMV